MSKTAASIIHESLLEANQTRIYLGNVQSVQRSEGPPVVDFLGDNLNPKEILFNVGSIVTGAKARPLELCNEVNVGDPVLIFSLELIYNNTFFYSPIRRNESDNDSLYMKYGNSELRFIPDGSDTQVKLASGKSVISVNPEVGSIRLDSDAGGIGIHAHGGPVNIQNNEMSMRDLLGNFIDAVSGLKVLTSQGPAGLTPSSIRDLMGVSSDMTKLLGKVPETHLYPHLPSDTYSVEFAAEVVDLVGIHSLNDEGDPNPSKSITALQGMFNRQPDQIPSTGFPIVSTVTPIQTPRVYPTTKATYSTREDVKLTTNFWLSQVSTKALFPHKLKAQHGRSKDDLTSNLQIVALNLLEPILAKYPSIRINSGFRGTPSLKGGRVSQHETGSAVDLQFPGFTNQQYFEAAEWIVQNVAFDTLIFEHGKSIWIHLTCKPKISDNRYRTLTMLNGKYESGIKRYK